MPGTSRSRRDFMRWSVATVAIGSTFDALSTRMAHGDRRELFTVGYGDLRPVRDKATGLELLRLPEGFSYRSFGWAGDPMSDGTRTPSAHDGMAVTYDDAGTIIMSRNHEIAKIGQPIGGPGLTYDNKATGGCTNLQFDATSGEWVKSWVSLSGTARNCAGGATPWGTWLTCEETTLGPGGVYSESLIEITATPNGAGRRSAGMASGCSPTCRTRASPSRSPAPGRRGLCDTAAG